MRHNESPDQRFGLREEINDNGERYWIIGKSK
jgi:hypothetical protein